MTRRRLPQLRDVPLLWKILVPFLVLMLAVGVIGSFAVVRSLSSRAQTEIDQELRQRTGEARSALHDRELSLLESVGFASNLQGMAEAIRRRDVPAVARLLRSVRALKPGLDVLTVTDATGRTVAGSGGTDWGSRGFVARTLRGPRGATVSAFDALGPRKMLFVASSVCVGTPCAPVGAAIVGFDTRTLARDLANVIGRANGVVLYDSSGRRLAAAGPASGRKPIAPQTSREQPVRVRERVSRDDVNTLFSSFELGGNEAGFLAVSVPTEPFFASVRATAWRLVILLLVAMAGIVAVGTLLARSIVAQLRPLVQTNRALGRGDYAARVPVINSDELGELATGLNDMAEQLQASHETLELRVRQRTEEVRRLLKERTQFFASVSHEFRTPLAVILGQVNMLRDADFRKANGPRSLETIQESSQQLLSLIDDLLAAARAEAQHLGVSLEPVQVADVVESVEHTLDGLARSGEHDLVIDVPEDLPIVRADPTRLREILLNLVDNSVKYTPPGGLVQLSAESRNGHVEVSVRDSGPGIPKRFAKKLFEPFTQAPGAKTQRGQSSSGLGLALTKRLVEAHGGEIWFESKKGAGTTFTFTLQPVRGE